MARPGAVTLAVFGTGEQARLQAIWLAKLRPVSAVLVHGRNPHKAAALCNDLKAHGLPARPTSAQQAVTADPGTSSTAPGQSPGRRCVAVVDGRKVGGVAHVVGGRRTTPAGRR